MSSGQMLANDGRAPDGTRILSPATVQYMMRNHLPGGRDLTEMGAGELFGLVRDGQGYGLGGAVCGKTPPPPLGSLSWALRDTCF